MWVFCILFCFSILYLSVLLKPRTFPQKWPTLFLVFSGTVFFGAAAAHWADFAWGLLRCAARSHTKKLHGQCSWWTLAHAVFCFDRVSSVKHCTEHWWQVFVRCFLSVVSALMTGLCVALAVAVWWCKYLYIHTHVSVALPCRLLHFWLHSVPALVKMFIQRVFKIEHLVSLDLRTCTSKSMSVPFGIWQRERGGGGFFWGGLQGKGIL